MKQTENNSYRELLDKLDAFTRKYYKNQIIRGVLYSVGLILAAYLVLAVLEYFGNFTPVIRSLMFYSLLIGSLGLMVHYIVFPLMRLMRLGKLISHEQAARIIGTHFTHVQDKLLNTLQLESQHRSNPSPLLLASIDQKTKELRPVPFTDAINLSENKRYLKYVMPPLMVMVVLLIAAPNVLTDSTTRIVRHTEAFEPVAPFQFVIQNESLEAATQEDFLLTLQMQGDAIPENVYIVANEQRSRMKKDGISRHQHKFRSVQADVPFWFEAGGFRSEVYVLKALAAPVLLHFSVQLEYPKYTGRPAETFRNMGNINVPEGTMVSWQFHTKDVDDLRMWINGEWQSLSRSGSGRFDFAAQASEDQRYAVQATNKLVQRRDSLPYRIQVIPDRYPTIEVEERSDTASQKLKYFNGLIKDDYGFSRLTFNYRFAETKDETRPRDLQRVNLGVAADQTQQQFFHFWNLRELGLKAGESVEYFFEVWDNDGVNGAKSSRSQTLQYRAPTRDELVAERDDSNRQIKEDLEKSMKEARMLQKEAEELSRELLEKKELSWQDQKKLEDLLKKQQNMQQRIDQMKQEQKRSNMRQEEYQQVDEQILEKQRRLEELFEQIMTDEMREMYERLEELMEKLDKDKIQEELDQMKWDNKDVEKELDRALEQFKQLELEMKMEETLDKLEELTKEQEELAQETESGETDSDELKEKQDALNEKFEELRKDLEDIKEKNADLENPMDLEDTGAMEESIEQDMQDSSDQLEQDQKSKASESQQNASQQMKQMANAMAAMMAAQQDEAAQENMDDLRRLLNNLIQLSFDQEDIMEELASTDKKDPRYTDLAKAQRKVKDDAKMVEDSLFALSKRVEQLQSIVNREISAINQNMGKTIEHLAERQTPQARTHQQYVMTAINNLALLLDEALQQMQQQMAQGQPGTGNCQKPGGSGSKPSPSSLQKMQDQLGKKIAEMEKMMGKNKGKSGSGGQDGMSKELAKMAAEQAAIRKAIEQMGQELNKDGSGSGNELNKLAKEMEEIEKDIVNKNIRPETLRRQQDIMIRLLESERAERERELDEKRESKEAKDYSLSNPGEFFEYNQRKQREIELLKTMPPSLKPYYKNKVNEYFIKFGL